MSFVAPDVCCDSTISSPPAVMAEIVAGARNWNFCIWRHARELPCKSTHRHLASACVFFDAADNVKDDEVGYRLGVFSPALVA